MVYRSVRKILAFALLWMPSALLLAQQSRLSGPVDGLQRVRLRGNLHPRANPQLDAGAADPSRKLDHVMVMLKRSAAQQAALDRLLAEQQDRSSGNYHAWLTPEQFGDRFGLSTDDISQVVSWLQSEGLVVDEISRARNWIWFSGTAAQIEAALRTEIRQYRVDGELHFANATEPSVPAALEPLITGIQGLDDFHPRAAQPRLRPQFTIPGFANFLVPDDFATIYDLAPLYNAGYNGSSQRIAVAGQSAVDLSDIRMFRSTYGLPKNDPQVVLVPGTSDPGKNGAEVEADLDIEWAGAVARNATIIYVYSNDVRVAAFYAINHNLAPILTFSFGLCEQLDSQSDLAGSRALAQQANAQGITWVASTGDSGAAGCDVAFKAAQASRGLGVSFPASLPEVTAVGGTQFDDAGGPFWSDSNSINLASALSYIPEKAWNESDADGLAASGGGLSILFPKPSWQSGPGVPDANFRAVPDVALSSAGHVGYFIVSGGESIVVLGTSAAAPAFAGILALAGQYQELNGAQIQAGQGNVNPNLYNLARNSAGVFHDIVSGDNIVPCVVGKPDCSSGTLGYAAGPGYDPVTGLGSVDGFNLAAGMAVQWSTPAIALLNPGSVIAGGADFTLAVNGSGFDSGAVVQWMGSPLPTTFVNSAQLLATVGAALIAAPGSADIAVLTSRGISAAVTLVIGASLGATISDQKVSATAALSCVVPVAATSFLATDIVHMYFSAKVSPSDLLTTDWLAPDGAVVPGVRFAPFTQPSSFCFTGISLILSNITFNPVGTWQARVFDHNSLVVAVSFTVTSPGYQTTPLAHAADGNGFRTTVLLTNAGTGPAPYTLRFNDDHGNIPATRFELEAGSLSGIVPAGGSVTIRTAGLGTAIVNGWAELTAPSSVGGSVIYSQKTGLPSIQEGTATIAASGSQHFFMPFDNTAKAITGVALTNAGASAANNISVTFRYSDGSNETLPYPQLASRNHQAFALASQFPHTANKSGVAEFTSDAALFVAVFRFNSTGAYTALDATPAGADATVKIRPLAHAANGNGFKTTVLLTNAGSGPAAYTLRFNDEQGNLPASGFALEAGSSGLTGVIPAGGSVTIRTAGLGNAIVSGWAELTAPGSVGGSVIYSQKTALPSIQEGTATIVTSGSQHFFLPFDNTAGAITGVAITDPGATTANNISVTFRYSDGTSEVVAYPPLPGRNHQAFALFTPFPNTANRSGVAEFTSDTPLSTVVFRFNSTGAFTSFGTVTGP